MSIHTFRRLWALTGVFLAVSAAVAAVLAAMPSPLAFGGFYSTSLAVGEQTGPDKPLEWRDVKVINSKDVLRFRWSTTDANAGSVKWTVIRFETQKVVASGVISTLPAAGKFGYVNVDFGKFIPAQPPTAGYRYQVSVATYPKVALVARGQAVPAISTSNNVNVYLTRPGAPVQFDDDMGYSRRQINIQMHTLDLGDEDDPSSSDEPYMVLVRFRFRVAISATGRVSMMPGTLQVSRVGDSSQNNMGHGDDNWCDEDDDPYDISGAGLSISETVPTGQSGWVIGAVVAMFEEDALSKQNANMMRDKIVEEATKAIAAMNFSGLSPTAISDPLTKAITHQVTSSIKFLNAGLPMHLAGLFQAADPDDYAGFASVIALTAPGGGLRMLAGDPPPNPSQVATQAVPVSGPSEFKLDFPRGDLSKVPGNAKYDGNMSIRGRITTRLIR